MGRRSLISRTPPGTDYRGIPMNCAPGVHEEAERLIMRHLDPGVDMASLKVLDVGAGYGAMSRRLLDDGFVDVVAWDLDPTQSRLPSLPVTPVDLDTDFGAAFPSAFDVVVAIEVIEHLENPRHFLRNLAQVLRAGGIALVSSPNVESAASRAAFLGHGGLRWFTRFDRERYGHITPVFSWQMRDASKAAGLDLVEKGDNSGRTLVTVEGGRSETAKALFALAMYPWMKGARQGDISLWLFRRVA